MPVAPGCPRRLQHPRAPEYPPAPVVPVVFFIALQLPLPPASLHLALRAPFPAPESPPLSHPFVPVSWVQGVYFCLHTPLARRVSAGLFSAAQNPPSRTLCLCSSRGRVCRLCDACLPCFASGVGCAGCVFIATRRVPVACPWRLPCVRHSLPLSHPLTPLCLFLGCRGLLPVCFPLPPACCVFRPPAACMMPAPGRTLGVFAMPSALGFLRHVPVCCPCACWLACCSFQIQHPCTHHTRHTPQ